MIVKLKKIYYNQSMKSAFNTITQNNMFTVGEKIGVAVSGGVDSMCLLHFLNANKDEFKISIVAINVDHSIRQNSANDSLFVKDYCKKNNIEFLGFKVEALKNANDNKLGIEESARNLRYDVFKKLIADKVVSKIALAHHNQDQVETVLLNLFRGSGLNGVSGMREISNNFVRPFLNTLKIEILNYAKINGIEFVEDETNFDTNYSRNFLRHEILPLLKKHWENVELNITNFSHICQQDDEFIESQIDFKNIILSQTSVKIPLSYFSMPNSLINRVLKYAFTKLNKQKDIEKKHIEILKMLANKGKNGDKINLPNGLIAVKEYIFLSIVLNKSSITELIPVPFKLGTEKILSTQIEVKKVNKTILGQQDVQVVDLDKIPANAVWRTRKNGDTFKKFGSGTKKLNDFLIDKKIPSRKRDSILVLANGNEILVVLKVEIADSVKTTPATKNIAEIKSVKAE